MCCITGPAGGRLSLNRGDDMDLKSKLAAYFNTFLMPHVAHTELQTLYLVDSHIWIA